MEDIDYRAARGLDKSVVRALAKDPPGSAIAEHFSRRILRRGQELSHPGLLAQKACRDGHSALYLRAAALLRELALARADGSLRHLLARLGRIEVLVIDDWAMAPGNESARREVWEICEDRYQTRSTVLTSQLPVSRWHERMGDPTIADGILDSLVPMPIASRCAESPCEKTAPTQGSKSGLIAIFYIEEQGQRGCCPFPLHPKSPPTRTSVRSGQVLLDHSEHLLHNHHASVASLRLLFTFAPERRSVPPETMFTFTGIPKLTLSVSSLSKS